MSKVNEVSALYKQLKSEWNTANPNLSKCENLLSDLKLELTNLMFLPTSNAAASKQELLLARDVLEIGVQWSIAANNIPAFERYIAQHPLSIEQYLMEGSYNKIFLAKGNVPAKSYNFFMDILLDTIRGEIAVCLEKAYEKISLKDVARMLYLPNEEAAKSFAVKNKKWKLGKDNFFHFTPEVKKTHEPIPSKELAQQAIEYAKELEMIV
ncbi:hypothetical protein NQ314_008121 [Rhamnusium bicolor]|uniref:CSN8/PSMD8/EIF3K domain-containing protein n=1 Tax=Rhamnusium bicolor TaxID=1586634 RepID=A0AAV8YEK0_9CUCU|nr:hypothetical protein NQ314_008121 [Rhamnusium bicolor]